MHSVRRTLLRASPSILVVDILFFGLLDPNTVASPLLIIGFLLVGLTCFYLTHLLTLLFKRTGFSIGRRQYKALMVATGLMVLMIALQSVGQLTTRDIAVILPLALLVYGYLSYPHTAEAP